MGLLKNQEKKKKSEKPGLCFGNYESGHESCEICDVDKFCKKYTKK